jgi:hypothetical protein
MLKELQALDNSPEKLARICQIFIEFVRCFCFIQFQWPFVTDVLYGVTRYFRVKVSSFTRITMDPSSLALPYSQSTKKRSHLNQWNRSSQDLIPVSVDWPIFLPQFVLILRLARIHYLSTLTDKT